MAAVADIPPGARIQVAVAVAEPTVVVPAAIEAIPAVDKAIWAEARTTPAVGAVTPGVDVAIPVVDTVTPAVDTVTPAVDADITAETGATIAVAEATMAVDADTLAGTMLEGAATIMAASTPAEAIITAEAFGPGLTMASESAFRSAGVIIPMRVAGTMTDGVTGNLRRAIPICTTTTEQANSVPSLNYAGFTLVPRL